MASMTAVLLRSSPVLASSLNSESRLPLLNDLRSRHVLREVHARFLVHRSLVNGTRAHRPALELRDERLLAVQKVELVAVQRLFHSVDDDR